MEYKKYLDNGINLIEEGKIDDAISSISQSIQLKNDWEISYFYRAVAYQSIEDFDNAMLDYTKSIQLNPRMTDAYYNRAKITLTRRDILCPDIDKAISDLEIALEQDENFIDALFAMAAAYKKKSDYQKSLDYLDKLLSIQPDAVHAKALKKLILKKYVNL